MMVAIGRKTLAKSILRLLIEEMNIDVGGAQMKNSLRMSLDEGESCLF